MHLQSLISKLHPLERAVIPFLKTEQELNALVKASRLQEVEVTRALQWLENKQVLKINTEKKKVVLLDEKGLKYKQQGLPEKAFLKILTAEFQPLSHIAQKAKLNPEEMNACIGVLKRKVAIDTRKDQELMVKLGPQGLKVLKEGTVEENFLAQSFPLDADKVTDVNTLALEELQKRKGFVKIEEQKKITVELLPLGKQLLKEKIEQNVVNRLTPEMLKTGSWKQKNFRAYDVEINVPRISGGRKHPLTAVMDLIREIFIEMGFQEMKGPWVETAFWCMDSMWIPQDHPAREVQDTFYLPYKGQLPDKKIVDKVILAHESGGDTGSKGYGYKWNPEVAKQLLLRTHTTATTYRHFGLKDIKSKEAAKYFYIGRIFRNEAIDATHLAEFHQVEGFVMNDNLSLKNLMGFIKEFYAKMGIHKIKFKVTYNPYTESSLEALYYDEKRSRWIELINSGIFRPESLYPYGIKKPVVAWGLGVERLAMILYERDKLKDLVGSSCDLNWIRSYQTPVRRD